MPANRAATRARRNPQDLKSAINKAMQAAPKREAAGEVVGEVVQDGEFQLTSPVAPVAEVTPGRPAVTSASCVKALEKAISFGRSALTLEVSVSLAVFASSSTGADLATKRAVMAIYGQVGYDTTPSSLDYKTANRRINASAALFNKLGRDAILEAMQGHRDGKAIECLGNHLTNTYNFVGINAVLEFAGKPREQTNTPEARAAREARDTAELSAAAVGVNARMAARQAERQALEASAQEDDGIIVSAGALSIVVPRNCTSADVRAMAARLDEFADRMDAEVGTPEEQRDRELHS